MIVFVGLSDFDKLIRIRLKLKNKLQSTRIQKQGHDCHICQHCSKITIQRIFKTVRLKDFGLKIP